MDVVPAHEPIIPPQGSRLRVYAVQVSVAARLPWHSDVANGSDYEAVLAIRSEGETAFKSNCAGRAPPLNAPSVLDVS